MKNAFARFLSSLLIVSCSLAATGEECQENLENWQEYFNKGCYAKAVENINKAILTNNTSAHNYTLRGELFMAQKKYDEAISDFSKSISLNKKDNDIARLNRAAAYIAKSSTKVKSEEAKTFFLKIGPSIIPLEIEYTMPSDMKNIKFAERSLSKKAKKDIEKSTSYHAEPCNHELLGVTEIYLGKHSDAIANFVAAWSGYFNSGKKEDLNRVENLFGALPPEKEKSNLPLALMSILTTPFSRHF